MSTTSRHLSHAELHHLASTPPATPALTHVRWLVLGVALLTGAATSSCVARGSGHLTFTPVTLIVVEEQPPPPRREVRPVVAVGYIWIDGRWDRRDDRWTWRTGRIERRPPGKAWTPGRWQPRGRGHVWIEGSWHAEAGHGKGRR